MNSLTDEEIDFLLELFDQTDPKLHRKIIAAFVLKSTFVDDLLTACEMLLKAGYPDGRYLAICQQDEWEEAASKAMDAVAKAKGGAQ